MQSEKTRERMKETKKRSDKFNDHGKEGFFKRLFSKKKKKQSKKRRRR